MPTRLPNRTLKPRRRALAASQKRFAPAAASFSCRDLIAALKQRLDPDGTKEITIRAYGPAVEIIIPRDRPGRNGVRQAPDHRHGSARVPHHGRSHAAARIVPLSSWRSDLPPSSEGRAAGRQQGRRMGGLRREGVRSSRRRRHARQAPGRRHAGSPGADGPVRTSPASTYLVHQGLRRARRPGRAFSFDREARSDSVSSPARTGRIPARRTSTGIWESSSTSDCSARRESSRRFPTAA